MWVLLFLAGFLGFIVAIGALLWSFIKKNKDLRKKSLIGGLLAMIMFFTGVKIRHLLIVHYIDTTLKMINFIFHLK